MDSWASQNCQRGLLIDKRIAGTITAEESARLEELNVLADQRLTRFPHPEPPVAIQRLMAEVRLQGTTPVAYDRAHLRHNRS